MAWPVIKCKTLVLPPSLEHGVDLWETLIEFTELRQGEWTLIGGQMVFLHALESGVIPPRVSLDLDVLVNARIVSRGVREFARALEEREFKLDGISPEGLAHRYRRRKITVDVLAPDGLGLRVNLTTTPPGRTVQVPGGTQALQRTELVPVVIGTSTGFVPRPSLLGAIISKAGAVEISDAPEAQRVDLVFLLSLVDDPRTMRGELAKRDRKRLIARRELNDVNHPAWAMLNTEAQARGRAALRLLTASN